MRKRYWIAALIAIAFVLLVANRHAVMRSVLWPLTGAVTGYSVAYDALQVGPSAMFVRGLRIGHGGDPLFDAKRVTIAYAARDLLPGSTHRFGVRAIDIESPVLTIVRHSDQSLNLPTGAALPAQRPLRLNSVPLRLDARVRNGTIVVVDDPVDGAPREVQRVEHLAVDAHVDDAGRTHLDATASLAGGGAVRAQGTIDLARGYAMHRIIATDVPLGAIANAAIDSGALRATGGRARSIDVKLYAFDVAPQQSPQYHLAGRFDIGDASLHLSSLAQPAVALHGTIELLDDEVFAVAARARTANTTVRLAGGIFDFAHPQLNIGIVGSGDLADLRRLHHSIASRPLAGRTSLGIRLTASADAPLVLIDGSSAHLHYGHVPLDDVRAHVAIDGQGLIFTRSTARYGGVNLTLHGALSFDDANTVALDVHARGPARAVPYLSALLAREHVVTDATLRGPIAHVSARGLLTASGEGSASVPFTLTGDGHTSIGPMRAAVGTGTVAAGWTIDRSDGDTAFWLDADGISLHPAPAFPGLPAPAIPLEGRVVHAGLAGGGSSIAPIVAGRVAFERTRIAGLGIDRLDASFAGPLAGALVSRLDGAGPWGRFSGEGSVSPHRIALRGTIDGTLQGLDGELGSLHARGHASGPFSIDVGPSGLRLASAGLAIAGGSVNGLPISRASGELSVAGGRLDVGEAQLGLAGGRVVAAGPEDAGIAFVARGIDASQLGALGLPPARGTIDAAGAFRGGQSAAFRGNVVLRDGRVGRVPVAGSAAVDYAGSSVGIADAVIGAAGAHGEVSGSISGLSQGAPAYNLFAHVAAGDAAAALDLARRPHPGSDGFYGADLHVTGEGHAPNAVGVLRIPVASVNGLPILDGSAALVYNGGFDLRQGRVQIGSTALAFSAQNIDGLTGVRVRSPRADLSDFDGLFDTGDTLAGTGALNARVTITPNDVSTGADINLLGLRYLNYPIGDTTASWSSRHGSVTGTLRIAGRAGTLVANGRVDRARSGISLKPGPDFWQRIVKRSRFGLTLSLTNLDLGTWLPALGYGGPFEGRLDGQGTVAGVFPGIALHGALRVHDGSIGRLPIDRLDASIANAGSRVRITQADLAVPYLTASGSGSFGFGKAQPLDLNVHAATTDVSALVLGLTRKHIDVAGPAESTLHVTGTPSDPLYEAGVDSEKLAVSGIPISNVFGTVRLQGRRLELRNAGFSLPKGQVTLAGGIPLTLSPPALGPETAPVSFDVQLAGIDPAAFAPLLGHNTVLGGRIDGHIGVSGTLADPRALGRFDLADGSYHSDVEHAPITGVTARLTFNNDSATLSSVFARLGFGTLSGSGDARLGGPGGSSFSVRARAVQAALDFPGFGRGNVDADLTLARRAPGQATLAGDVTLSDAVLPFAAFLGSSGGASLPVPFQLGLDVHVQAGRNVRVRGGQLGAGLDIGASGRALIAGSLDKPTLDGEFDSTGGTLTYFDRLFRVQDATVIFHRADGILPILHAVGTTHVLNPDPDRARNPLGSTDVSIAIDGPISGLRFHFTTSPPGYSDDQVIAMLAPFSGLIGRPGSQTPGVAAIAANGAATPYVPAGVIVQRDNGALSVGQEAFNILNAQFTSALLAPIEEALGQSLGEVSLNFTFDYYGAVGVNLRRQIARKLYATYGTTFGLPRRQSVGLAFAPSEATAAQFSFYTITGPLLFIPGTITPFGTNGFSFTLQRVFR